MGEKKPLPKTFPVAPRRCAAQSPPGGAPDASGVASGFFGTGVGAGGGAWVRGSPASGRGDSGRAQASLPLSFLLQRLPLLFREMAVRTPSTGWVRRGGLGMARDRAGKASRGGCARAERFEAHPRERFPRPGGVWPSGAAVPSALLKGDRWLGRLGVGSPRVLGIRESQGVQGGRKARPAEGGSSLASRPAGWRPFVPPRIRPASVSRRPGHLAGGRGSCPRAFP